MTSPDAVLVDAKPAAAGLSTDAHAEGFGSRRRFGLIVAPLAFCAVIAAPLSGLAPAAHRLAAIMAAVMVLWMTEALSLPVTALVGATLCVVLQVAPAKEVFVPFADPLIFLFIGAFILSRALLLHRLDKRLALAVLSLRWVGDDPRRVLIAFGAATAFLSVWVANAATTAMMYGIAVAIVTFLSESAGARSAADSRRFATILMLMTTFAASVGGLTTPVGAAPNLIGIGFIRRLLEVEFSFVQWCALGIPAALLLFVFLAVYLGLLMGNEGGSIPGFAARLRDQRDHLGPWTMAQRGTLAAWLVTITLWLLPSIFAVFGDPAGMAGVVHRSCPEPVAALIGALLLFLLPGHRGERLMTWKEAAQIDWGILLLFGGGLSLGVLSFQTGLAGAVGRTFAAVLPSDTPLGMLIAATITAAVVSEVTSNTASANMIVPIAILTAQSAGLDPLEPALGATFGSGLGFMLPVSTPCNAIVFSSGYVPLRKMMLYGALLDFVGIIIVVTVIHCITPLIR